jgi:hypothetical protein
MGQHSDSVRLPGTDLRPWLIGVLIALAIVVVAAVAVILTGHREDVVYEPGSPETVVQAYADAWAAGDVDAAWQLLTPRAQSRVARYEYRNAMRWDEEVPSRVWVDGRRDYDDHVVLTLSVEHTWDGLFGPQRDIQTVRLSLVELDGEWLIDTPIVGFEPW